MSKPARLLDQILRGTADASIGFADLCHLLILLGFDERIRGDHHIFTKDGVHEILILQPDGSRARPHQVKQVRNVIVKYRLAADRDHDEV